MADYLDFEHMNPMKIIIVLCLFILAMWVLFVVWDEDVVNHDPDGRLERSRQRKLRKKRKYLCRLRAELRRKIKTKVLRRRVRGGRAVADFSTSSSSSGTSMFRHDSPKNPHYRKRQAKRTDSTVFNVFNVSQSSPDSTEGYIEAVEKEIELTKKQLGRPKRHVHGTYIGFMKFFSRGCVVPVAELPYIIDEELADKTAQNAFVMVHDQHSSTSQLSPLIVQDNEIPSTSRAQFTPLIVQDNEIPSTSRAQFTPLIVQDNEIPTTSQAQFDSAMLQDSEIPSTSQPQADAVLDPIVPSTSQPQVDPAMLQNLEVPSSSQVQFDPVMLQDSPVPSTFQPQVDVANDQDSPVPSTFQPQVDAAIDQDSPVPSTFQPQVDAAIDQESPVPSTSQLQQSSSNAIDD